jgi:nickel transport protein
VVVDDELGHRLEVAVPVNEALALNAEQKTATGAGDSLSRYEKALMGVSIIFGMCGVLFWWQGKRIRSRQRSGNTR